MKSKLLLLDLNDEDVREFFTDLVKETKLQTLEDMGFVYVQDLGYINKEAVVGSEIAGRVLGLYGKAWKQLLNKATKDNLPVYKIVGGNRYKVKELLEYQDSKRYQPQQ